MGAATAGAGAAAIAAGRTLALQDTAEPAGPVPHGTCEVGDCLHHDTLAPGPAAAAGSGSISLPPAVTGAIAVGVQQGDAVQVNTSLQRMQVVPATAAAEHSSELQPTDDAEGSHQYGSHVSASDADPTAAAGVGGPPQQRAMLHMPAAAVYLSAVQDLTSPEAITLIKQAAAIAGTATQRPAQATAELMALLCKAAKHIDGTERQQQEDAAALAHMVQQLQACKRRLKQDIELQAGGESCALLNHVLEQ